MYPFDPQKKQSAGGGSNHSLVLSVYLLLLAFFVVLTSQGEFVNSTDVTDPNAVQADGSIAEGDDPQNQQQADTGFHEKFSRELYSKLPIEGLQLKYDDDQLDVLLPLASVFAANSIGLQPEFSRVVEVVERSFSLLAADQLLVITAGLSAPQNGQSIQAERQVRLRREQSAVLARRLLLLPNPARFAGIGYVDYAAEVVVLRFSLGANVS